MTASSTSDAVTGGERHGFVDALRGFALLGILFVNIEYIVQPLELGWFEYRTDGDEVVRWLITTLGQAKIYPLFALLFGYGISIQLASAARRGTELGPRYRRRMVGVALLGVLHGLLFFPGDILVIYAAVGVLAFRFRQADRARLVRIAVRVYAVAAVAWFVVGGLELLEPPAAPTVSAETLAVYEDGSFLDVVAERFWPWLVTQAFLAAVQGPAVFAFFLVGIALGRTDVLSHPDRHRALARRVLRWSPLALLGAAAGATMTVAGGRWDSLGFAVGFASAPLLSAAYVAGLAVLLRGRVGDTAGRLLEAGGRMSLTVYLMQSVVVSTLSYGYGFGLFGTVDPLDGALLAVAVWAGLCGSAVLWLRFARFGPFEWALRSFTYRRAQPLLRLPSSTPRT